MMTKMTRRHLSNVVARMTDQLNACGHESRKGLKARIAMINEANTQLREALGKAETRSADLLKEVGKLKETVEELNNEMLEIKELHAGE